MIRRIKALIGPITAEQFYRLRKYIDPMVDLKPIIAGSSDIYYTNGQYSGLVVGNLSKLFNDYYSKELDVVINLESRVEVDWSKFSKQFKIGIFGAEAKRAFECHAMAKYYDKLLIKCPIAFQRFLNWGYQVEKINWIPSDLAHIDNLIKKTTNKKYKYDICFLGTTNNENWAEYPDRYRLLKKILQVRENYKCFFYTHVAMSKKRQLHTYSLSKITFRDAANFRKTSPQHIEFVAEIWALKRTVIFWYVEPGVEPEYKTLVDGFNCIFYSDLTFLEKVKRVISDDQFRNRLLINAFESRERLYKEVWSGIGNQISRAIKDLCKETFKSNENKGFNISLDYLNSKSPLYSKYHDPLCQSLTFLTIGIGNKFAKNNLLKNKLITYIDFINSLKRDEHSVLVKASLDLSNIVAYLTIATIDTFMGKRIGDISIKLKNIKANFIANIELYFNINCSEQDFLHVYHRYPSFLGPRQVMASYEIDRLCQFSNKTNFRPLLKNYYLRNFYEICGDLLMLNGIEEPALEYYKTSGKIELPVASYRAELKISLLQENQILWLAALNKCLENEPINRFYMHLNEGKFIAHDINHPGFTISAYDASIFEKIFASRKTNYFKAKVSYREFKNYHLINAIDLIFSGKNGLVKKTFNYYKLLYHIFKNYRIIGYVSFVSKYYLENLIFKVLKLNSQLSLVKRRNT